MYGQYEQDSPDANHTTEGPAWMRTLSPAVAVASEARAMARSGGSRPIEEPPLTDKNAAWAVA